jgi:hypothetical protein
MLSGTERTKRMDRVALKKEYRQTKQPMGVYRVRNHQNGKSYIGFATNLQARLNRLKFELKYGIHVNAELLAEWKSFGESAFEIDVLDVLDHSEKTDENDTEALQVLAEMWVRDLEKNGSDAVLL